MKLLEWANLLYQGPQCLCFWKITVKVINLLLWFNKTKFFLGNAKNTDRDGIKVQNTHTTHWEKLTLERLS